MRYPVAPGLTVTLPVPHRLDVITTRCVFVTPPATLLGGWAQQRLGVSL